MATIDLFDSPLKACYGWAATPLGVLVERNHELQRLVLFGGPETTQLFAALLADPAREAALLADPDASAQRLAHVSRRELLLTAFGSVPEGFQPGLAKLGSRAIAREAYDALHRPWRR